MSETERLIKAVCANPLLWDKTHADYKNFNKREEIWYNIYLKFGSKNNVDWKKKFKNLKDSYVKYLKAQNTKDFKQNSVLKRYRCWPWASKMEFLKPFLKINKPSESMQSEKQWFDLPDGVFSEDSLKGFPEDDSLGPREESFEINHLPSSHLEPENLDQEQQYDHGLEQEQEQVFFEEEIQHIDVDSLRFDSKEDKTNSKAVKRKISAKSKNDDIDLVLMGYAKTIKTFSPKRQTMVKFKFSKILMEAELEQLEENESSGPTPSDSKKKVKIQRSSSPLSYESFD